MSGDITASNWNSLSSSLPGRRSLSAGPAPIVVITASGEIKTMVLFRYESGGVVLFDRAAAPFIDLSGFPTNSTDSLRSSLSRFLAEKLAATGYVEMIYMSAIDKEVDLWTVVTEDSEPVREKLYNVELEILKRFKDVLFDFHIYFKDDVSPEQFDGDPHIQRIYP